MICGLGSSSSVLQDIKEITSHGGPSRFRLLLSDGLRSWSCEYDIFFKNKRASNSTGKQCSVKLYVSSMAYGEFVLYMEFALYVCTAFLLATQLNYLQEQNLLVPQCICMLKRSVATTMKDGRYYFRLCSLLVCIALLTCFLAVTLL